MKNFFFIFIILYSCLSFKNSDIHKDNIIEATIGNIKISTTGYSIVYYYPKEKKVEIYLSNSKENYLNIKNFWWLTFPITDKGIYELDNTTPPKLGIIYTLETFKEKKYSKEYQSRADNLKINYTYTDLHVNGIIDGSFTGQVMYINCDKEFKDNIEINGNFSVKITNIVE